MKNIKRSDFFIYILAIGLCITTYIVLDRNIEITLLPHKTAISFLYNYNFEFIPNIGYQQTGGLFAIAQNCLGGKLFVSLFLILVFGFLHEYKNIKQKIIALTTFYFASMIIAFIATIVRISASIPFNTMSQFVLIHNMISLAIYFMTGFALYFVMEKRRSLVCISC